MKDQLGVHNDEASFSSQIHLGWIPIPNFTLLRSSISINPQEPTSQVQENLTRDHAGHSVALGQTWEKWGAAEIWIPMLFM